MTTTSPLNPPIGVGRPWSAAQRIAAVVLVALVLSVAAFVAGRVSADTTSASTRLTPSLSESCRNAGAMGRAC